VNETAPLMFLGRLDQIKGAHNAIKAAKATNRILWIAGNLPDTADNIAYFRAEIEPHIDGEQVVYLGALNDEQKNYYLGRARALLFPIEWDEPFGMVMIEAMSCGTPVIAFKRGSVQEIVQDGKNGYVVPGVNGIVERLTDIDKIDRADCRKTAEVRFDIDVISQNYLSLFKQ
jgi:glycosyltransferase involved in cell wall biosynthesis